MSHHSCNEALRQRLARLGHRGGGDRGCAGGRLGLSEVTLGVRTERCDGGREGVNAGIDAT